MILYNGAFVGGASDLLAVRPDGSGVPLPPIKVRQGGYRFLPDGTGIVYAPSMTSQEFWLLDLKTKARRQIAKLDPVGLLRTFDITPDRASIVFDRMQQNSHVVLIEVPKAGETPGPGSAGR